MCAQTHHDSGCFFSISRACNLSPPNDVHAEVSTDFDIMCGVESYFLTCSFIFACILALHFVGLYLRALSINEYYC